MEAPIDYEGPELVTVIKEPKTDGRSALEESLKLVELGKTVGTFQRDQLDGDFTKMALDMVSSKKDA